jgi:transposase
MEPTQDILLEIPEQPEAVRTVPLAMPEPAPSAPKLKPIDRSQGLLRSVIVEELVGPEHKVRAIWDLTGTLDLSGFLGKIKSREGKAGSSAWDPRLLLSVRLYAYSEQVGSAREISRLMEYEPGLMWLSGLGEVNYHTLADFRTAHEKELKELLAELLGILSKEGFVKLELVAHDGTKIRSQGGADSFRREGTLEKETAKAQQMVEEIEQAAAGNGEGEGKSRREAARERAARERLARMKLAGEELQKIRESKDRPEEAKAARVSLSEPEARVMKHSDGAIAPSYNLQLSTDAAKTVVVGMQLTQCSSDSGSLLPAMDELKETMGQYPQQGVADGGYTNHAAIVGMEERGVEFYGSLSTPAARQAGAMKAAGIDPRFGAQAFTHDAEKRTLQCPAGKALDYLRQSQKRGARYQQFQARAADCQGCAFRKSCCPPGAEARLISIRIRENAEVAAFRAKMETPQAQQIYRRRGPTAEFPNSWIKEKLGIRKFRLRGLAKARAEALWGVVTYDVMQWIRLSWRRKQLAAAAAAA